jgi:ubiquinone/menaquinone biosynthesis C-methylase UbiE
MEESGVMPDERWLEDPRAYRSWKKRLELLLGSSAPKGLILDAGCGPGTSGIILAEMGATVIGVDISSEAVGVAKERARRKAVDFSPVLGDLESLGARNQSFDVCFCGWVLHHLPEIRPALSEVTRVLKPGGRILIVEPNESNLAVRLSRLVEGLAQRWISRAGWDTPNRSTHLHNHYAAALQELGFTDIQINSCFGGELLPLPVKPQSQRLSAIIPALLRLAFRLRTLCFMITAKVLRPPLNGPELLVAATLGDNARQEVHPR